MRKEEILKTELHTENKKIIKIVKYDGNKVKLTHFSYKRKNVPSFVFENIDENHDELLGAT